MGGGTWGCSLLRGDLLCRVLIWKPGVSPCRGKRGAWQQIASLQENGHRDPPPILPAPCPLSPNVRVAYRLGLRTKESSEKGALEREEMKVKTSGATHRLLCDPGQDVFPLWASVLSSAKAD